MESYLTRVMSAESELITGELPPRQLLKFHDLTNWIYIRKPMVLLNFLSICWDLKIQIVRPSLAWMVQSEVLSPISNWSWLGNGNHPNLVPKFRSYSSRRGPWKRGWNHLGLPKALGDSRGLYFQVRKQEQFSERKQ